MKRLLFIYNPVAGKGKIRTRLAEVMETLSAEGYELIVHPTSGPKDAQKVAERYAREGLCDRIVCAGGDGTFAEAAGGILYSDTEVPLGYIPEGTTNDFAYSLKLPAKLEDAVKVTLHGKIQPSDIATINDKPFVYSAAFGLFTDVTYETPQSVKNVIGRMAYLLNGAKKLMHIKTYNIAVQGDGFSVRDEFIHGIIANSNSVGGFKGITGKNVEFDDGYFEMILVKKPKKFSELNEIINALLTNNLEHCQYICYERVNQLEITTEDELPWTLDGEFGGDMRTARITVHKQKIRYIV